MTHVDVVGYREWAHNAFRLATGLPRIEYQPRADAMHYREDTAETCEDADVVFLVGWSALVPPAFYRKRLTLVVHPSPLPRYRGGSPIQWQIIRGEDDSAVSIFRLDDAHPSVDSGPLCFQRGYSLDGSLEQVLARIAKTTATGIRYVLDAYPNVEFWEQPAPKKAALRRRTPVESEISVDEIKLSTARQLHDKVRALQDPYPNAFIVGADGRRLYITGTHLDRGDSDETAGNSTARR